MNKLFILLVLLLVGCGGSPGDPGIQGDGGVQGPPGPQGTQGPTGPMGTAGGTIQSGFYCTAQDNSYNGGSYNLAFTYNVVVFNSGAKFVSCSVTNNRQTQYTNTRVYAPTESGMPSAQCAVVDDLSGNNNGTWTFTTTAGVSQVQYIASNEAFSGHMNTFLDSNCSRF